MARACTARTPKTASRLRMKPADGIAALLRRMRDVLGLDACFITEVGRSRRTIRFVEGEIDSVGADPLEPSDPRYCQLVLESILPAVAADAPEHPAHPSSYVGFPILMSAGRVYGTLCVLGHETRPTLDDRDLAFVRMISEMLAEQLAVEGRGSDEYVRLRRQTERILEDPLLPRMFLQPVVDLVHGGVVGFEALSRFDRGKPETVFADAWAVGLGEELELKAAARALALLDRLPTSTSLSVNVSPKTMLSEKFVELVGTVEARRLIVEITEHDAIESYAATKEAIDGVLDRGVRLAIDDVGAGYSSLSHIMELSPDIVKLDIVFTRDIDSDRVRRALTEALVTFGHSIDAVIVGEGVESAAELSVLRKLGLELGQGFYIGRPAPIEQVVVG